MQIDNRTYTKNVSQKFIERRKTSNNAQQRQR